MMNSVAAHRGSALDSLTPPHDLDAERSVLGAILIEPAVLPVARGIVESRHYWRAAHATIYRTILTLADAGQGADLVLLAAALERAGTLDDVGGRAYLAALVDGVPRATNVGHYAQVVAARARERDLLAALRRGIAAVGTDADTDDLADRIAAECLAIGAGRRLSDEDRVVAEMARESARREARRRLDAAERGATAAPVLAGLPDILARPLPPVRYRIDGWLPVDSRIILAAAAKTGKTTLVGSLVRSLVDGDDWLDVAPVHPLRGRLALLDLEMSEGQLAAWLRAQELRRADRVVVASLRGRASTLDLLDARARQEWAARLRAADVQYLIIDPLRPVLDAIGLDEHTEAGRYLTAIDALLADAGIPEACIVHHMGHSGERSRGDSRLRDWPDIELKLVRESEDPASPRYLSAYGRDVDVTEARLAYDPLRRRLSVAGGSRRDSRRDAALNAIIGVISGSTATPTGRSVKSALRGSEHPRDLIDAALRHGVEIGRLAVDLGPRGARLYRLGVPLSGTVRRASEDAASECPAASIEADTRSLDQLNRVSGGYRV